MAKITGASYTSSTFRATLKSDEDFKFISLSMREEDAGYTEADRYSTDDKVSTNTAITYNSDNGLITVDLNMLPFSSIYYKSFKIILLDKDGKTVDKTGSFSFSPKGKTALYGIVNKLTFEFKQLAKFSGTTLMVFSRNPTSKHCPDCWDEELNQSISSTCGTCGGTGMLQDYITHSILSRKIKTQSSQGYKDKGSDTQEQSVFQSYARLDFPKGLVFFDETEKQFYEVSNRNVANIGGVRTSTTIVGKSIKSNDSRVESLLRYI